MDIIMNLRQTGSAIPRHWIILDSASSPDIFYAEELVKDNTKSDTPLNVLSRGGITKAVRNVLYRIIQVRFGLTLTVWLTLLAKKPHSALRRDI
jgi:hypothetical protein